MPLRAGDKRPGELGPEYLGDGVYVSFNGFALWLRTDREDDVHEIALEPGFPEQLIHLHKLFIKQAQELRTEAQF